jgi:hypothetical protein
MVRILETELDFREVDDELMNEATLRMRRRRGEGGYENRFIRISCDQDML